MALGRPQDPWQYIYVASQQARGMLGGQQAWHTRAHLVDKR